MIKLRYKGYYNDCNSGGIGPVIAAIQERRHMDQENPLMHRALFRGRDRRCKENRHQEQRPRLHFGSTG